MTFELYKKTRTRTQGDTVSITSAGMIVIDRTLAVKYLNGCEYVQLYYDPTEKKVGIKPLRSRDRYSVKLVRQAQDSERAMVSGRGFLNAYKLAVSEKEGKFKKQQCAARFEDGMIVFTAD